MNGLSELKRALADRYAIEREIGAGGMATVYLARDLRHDRPVALKLLNPELGAVLGVERFLAEIKVTANLQHPNLLPLFDSGEASGQLFYVMPFVEGESLRARLEREKQLPIDEALHIAVAAAKALDYAHGHGVIHRDLKPENILIQAGQPLVADFGIALAVSKAGGNRITQTGLSLGTPQYMSPEQATGDRAIDGRSDIYSLAAVTYEMLTGEPPHIGNTSQAIIARVLTERPRPARTARPAVPEHVEAALDHALEKLPADRFATAREFADALQGRGTTRATTGAAAGSAPAAAQTWRARLRDPLVLGLGVLTLASLGFALTRLRRPVAEASLAPVRFLFGGSDSAPAVLGIPWPAALSPDGGMLVYPARDRSGAISLYSRRLDQLEARPIPGTTEGRQPHFSPDGQWLAFENDGKEKKVRLDGSAPVTISDGASANGAAWTSTGQLVVGATRAMHGLSRVSTAGGELTPFTVPDSSQGEQEHLWPIAFPDGRTIVFTRWFGTLATARLGLTSLDDGKVTPLDVKAVRPLALLDGALVYLQVDGAVMAVPLDRSGTVGGTPVPVHDPVLVLNNNNGNSEIFISQGGALVSSRGSRRTQMMWTARDGTSRPVSSEVRDFSEPRLSPDGKQIAVLVTDRDKTDVWIHDLETGTLSRLTSAETVTSARWSRDGKRIVYTATGSAARGAVWVQPVEAASPPEELARYPGLLVNADLAPDGKSLLIQVLGEGGWDVLRVRLDSGAATRPFVATNVTDLAPRFSPDGHWVVLSSAESGRMEVYVRSYPDPTVKVQVSAGGGVAPMWSADGSRVYYQSGGEAVLEARLAITPVPRVISRDTLFRRAFGAGSDLGSSSPLNFEVTRDGRLLTATALSNTYQLVVVPNWITEFRARMAAARR
jgi:eukaryotic-like serine/threonine-protein kinase